MTHTDQKFSQQDTLLGQSLDPADAAVEDNQPQAVYKVLYVIQQSVRF